MRSYVDTIGDIRTEADQVSESIGSNHQRDAEQVETLAEARTKVAEVIGHISAANEAILEVARLLSQVKEDTVSNTGDATLNKRRLSALTSFFIEITEGSSNPHVERAREGLSTADSTFDTDVQYSKALGHIENGIALEEGIGSGLETVAQNLGTLDEKLGEAHGLVTGGIESAEKTAAHGRDAVSELELYEYELRFGS